MNKCKNCEKETKNPKFCSRSCAASFNNVKHPKRKPEGKCKHCRIQIPSCNTYCKDCWAAKPVKIKEKPKNLRNQNVRIKKKECKNCSNLIPWDRTYCSECIKLALWAPKQKLTAEEKANIKELYCPKCKTTKSSKFFSFNRQKGVWSGYCRACYSEDVKQRFRQFKQKCADYKGGKCQKCGYDKCLGSLEFHHRDPSKKEFNFGGLRYSSWEKSGHKVIPELDKCDLLCANCHREVHY